MVNTLSRVASLVYPHQNKDMNKYLKWGLIITAVLGIGLYIAYLVMIAQTKKHSPEETVTYNQGSYDIEVFYNRPYKKERVIFGSLVAYGEVWRTGANEATTFETKTDLNIDGKVLKAGKYTLWTIPEADTWTIIFNDKQYNWGVGPSGASREAEHDALQVKVPIETLNGIVEQFTIAIEGKSGTPSLALMWDQTKVSVLLK